MSRRRRGADFSHLLESFGTTRDCGSDLNTNVQNGLSSAYSNASSERIGTNERASSSRSFQDEENSGTCSYKSTILAGQAAEPESQGSTENSYQTACSGSPVDRPPAIDVSSGSCRSEVPSSMNRAINLQLAPQSDLDLTQSTSEPRRSDELNKNIETSEKSSPDTRDTNYNIQNNPEACSCPNSRLLRLNSPRPGRMASSTPTRNDSESKIMRRLSQEFLSSPHRFTERLVTIIDETESGYENGENSGVNLSRMTKEFRKMCKFIQDESMPEHMNSTIGFSRQQDDNKILANTQRPETIEESVGSSDDEPETPETTNPARKIYRKTPLNIFKKAAARENQETGSPGSPNSTRNFINLEKYLNELPPSPSTRDFKAVRSISPSDITEQFKDKMRIVAKSKEQLASLDETNPPEYETFDSHTGHGAQKRQFYDPRIDLDACHSPLDERKLNEDELSMSLRVELAKQRERCFETARQMQKIEEDAMASNEAYPQILERYGIDPEAECRKTIKSLLAYKNCWTKIRENDHLKRNEMSSLDSGIDTRSISRTFHASSKKSSNHEPSSRISAKSTRACETGSKSPRFQASRSHTLRLGSTNGSRKTKLTPGNTLAKNSIKILSDARRRSPSHLCPTAAALARSRSRSAEKASKNRQLERKIVDSAPTGSGRGNENRMNFLSPDVIVARAEVYENHPISRESNDEKSHSGKVARTTLIRARSPSSKYHFSSPRDSPKVGQTCHDRLGKKNDLAPTGSPAAIERTRSPRNRFFVTPGKTLPVKTARRKSQKFFPSMDADIQQEGNQRIMKSPYAPGIYRMGFNSVMSPVRMYIHGTDMKLIQNIQPRRNEMLLTPTKASASEEKLKFKLSAKTPTSRDSPQNKHIFTDERDSESRSSDDESDQENKLRFALPKTNYEPPSRVRTITESPKNIGGARGLLRSMQNRVVIRHEGKIPGKYNEDDLPESGNDSVDMSIHVQRSAEKTNYMNRRK